MKNGQGGSWTKRMLVRQQQENHLTLVNMEVTMKPEPIILLWITPKLSFTTVQEALGWRHARDSCATHYIPPLLETFHQVFVDQWTLNTSAEVWRTWKELQDCTEHAVHHHTGNWHKEASVRPPAGPRASGSLQDWSLCTSDRPNLLLKDADVNKLT